MFYHFLAPEGGHPTLAENLIPKCKAVTLSPSSKLIQQKQMLFQKVQQILVIHPSNIYDFFPVILILTNHEPLYIITIVLGFHPPFELITAIFTITGLSPTVCDNQINDTILSNPCPNDFQS